MRLPGNLSREQWTVAGTAAAFFGGSIAISTLLLSISYTAAPDFCETDGYNRIAGIFACGATESMLYRPLYPWMIAVMNNIAGSTLLFSGKLLSALFGALFISGTFFTAYAHTKKYNVALFGALLTAVNAQVLFNSTLACTDITCAFFVLAVCHFALKALKGRNLHIVVFAAGLFSALAVLIRVQAYFLVIPLCIAGVLLPDHPFKKKLKAAGIISGGFALPMFFAALIDPRGGFDAAGLSWILGIKHLISRVPEAILNIQGAGSPGAAPPMSIGEKLTLSLHLLAQTSGYIPLLGVFAFGFFFKKAPKIFITCTAAGIFYFIGISWFPIPEHTEIKRLYIFYVPLFAVAFSAALLGDGAKSARHPFTGKKTTVLFFITSIITSWASFPSIVATADYGAVNPLPVFRESIGPAIGVQNAVEAAIYFDEKFKPECEQVIVTSLGATGSFKNVFYEAGINDSPYEFAAWVANENRKAGIGPPKYLMTDDDLTDKVKPADWDIWFTPVGSHGDFTFYEIEIKPAVSDQISK